MRDVLRDTKGLEHNHHYDKAKGETPADGVKHCPICSRHDHTHGSRYCPICNPGTLFVRADGRNEDEMSHCRYGCDPRTFLIEMWVEESNEPMPDGVMGKTTAVKPCPVHAPEAHEAWAEGQWGSMAGMSKRRKGRAKPVNDA